jgi:hypothetical protein
MYSLTRKTQFSISNVLSDFVLRKVSEDDCYVLNNLAVGSASE